MPIEAEAEVHLAETAAGAAAVDEAPANAETSELTQDAASGEELHTLC